MGGAVPVLQPRGCPSEHAMDEVLLIHDWQAVPHVAMNLLSAVTGRAPQLLWTICAVHGAVSYTHLTLPTKRIV